MIKGARRQLIVLRTGNSRYFDEAYFVLKSEEMGKKTANRDLIREANRILAESIPHGKAGKKGRGRRFLLFGAGSLCGAVLGVLAALLLL